MAKGWVSIPMLMKSAAQRMEASLRLCGHEQGERLREGIWQHLLVIVAHVRDRACGQ